MSVNDPITYSDWYWNASIEATRANNEAIEQELAPFVAEVIRDIIPTADLPPSIKTMFNTMSSPPAPAWSTIMAQFASQANSSVQGTALNHALLNFNYSVAAFFKSLRLTPQEAETLYARHKITEEMYDARVLAGGYSPAEAAAHYEVSRPYPSIPDLIAYARFISDPFNPKGEVLKLFDVSLDDYELWNWLSQISLTVGERQTLFKRNVISEDKFTNSLGKIGYRQEDIPFLKELCYAIPNSMLLVQANLIKNNDDSVILRDIIKGDVHPDYANMYYDAVRTKSPAADIIAYMLRKDPQLYNLESELRKIGIHPNYFPIYKELAYQIPAIGDIISMSVKHAFDPAIINKLGLNDDFPADLEKYAAMKGLSSEWSHRYWIAHWTHPALAQGYDMLHRGIITKEDLDLLIQISDIPPYWRDKLSKLAYNIYNRLDVRRLYSTGILSKEQVKKAYSEMGYDETKAQQLTDYTIQAQITAMTGFSSKTVIASYSKGIITESEAVNILNDMKISPNDIQSIMKSANYKKNWELKSLQIDGIEHSYKTESINEQAARNQLFTLQIDSNEINALITKWKLKITPLEPALWTASQTLSLYKRGTINLDRAIRELGLLGYDKEHIDAMLENARNTS